jgi:hypothetical protein
MVLKKDAYAHTNQQKINTQLKFANKYNASPRGFEPLLPP